MKLKIVKYVFALFIVGITIFAIYSIYFKEKENTKQIEEDTTIEQNIEIKDLRLGISNYDTINPLLTNNKEMININKLIFEPLIMLGEDYKPVLCLAKECSKTSPTSYVIKVDNNIQWQDGSDFTVKDIQFTIDRLKENKSIYSYNVEKIVGVELLDASTIKLNLSEEVPFFEYNLTFPILPNNYYLNEEFYTSVKTPIGTGMYKIEKIENGSIALVKNEKWWKSKENIPKIEKINIKLYAEIGEVYNSFKLGNIDIFTTTNTNLENYIGTIGYAKNEFKGREFDYLAFNCGDSILQSSAVREAIALAIDKSNIVSSVYNNEHYISEFPLDYGNYVYKSKNVSSNYNVEQAKKNLIEQGWEYKNNSWQKRENGKTQKLNFDLTVNSSNTQRVTVAENIKSQLAQIGIKITVRKVSDAQYKNIITKKNYEMLLTGVYNSYSPDLSTFFGNANLQNYNNEEINSILNEVKNIAEENVLKEKYNKIQEIYKKEMPFISLYRNKNTVIKSQNLAGEVNANNYCSYYNLEKWYRM